MAQDLNVVVLSGELSQDPELRYTGGGTAVCGMSLKVTTHYKNNGEWNEKEQYFDLQAWGEKAEQMGNSLRQGDRIQVQGELTQNIWDDDSGTTHYDTEVKVRKFGTLDENGGSQHAQADPKPEPADQRRQNPQQGQGGGNNQGGQKNFESDEALPF